MISGIGYDTVNKKNGFLPCQSFENELVDNQLAFSPKALLNPLKNWCNYSLISHPFQFSAFIVAIEKAFILGLGMLQESHFVFLRGFMQNLINISTINDVNKEK
jgi:hypothetical protein